METTRIGLFFAGAVLLATSAIDFFRRRARQKRAETTQAEVVEVIANDEESNIVRYSYRDVGGKIYDGRVWQRGIVHEEIEIQFDSERPWISWTKKSWFKRPLGIGIFGIVVLMIAVLT